jgi:septum formation protein
LLTRIGLVFEVSAADIDETRHPDEAPGVFVERLAREKARAVGGSEDIVVGADTAVVFGSAILGKPAHPAEARSMLQRLQGKSHDVFTGIAVRRGDQISSMVDVTQVEMLAMTEDEIDAYVSTGEPMDKAGSYALQGRGGLFVSSVTGSPFTVIGLPVHLLPRLIRAVGVDPEDVLRPV